MPAPITPFGQTLPPISNSAFVDERGFLTTLGLNTLQQLAQGASVLTSYAVGALPDASSAGEGAVAFATDSNRTLIVGIGTPVVAGGSNKVPIYSDGTNWIIG